MDYTGLSVPQDTPFIPNELWVRTDDLPEIFSPQCVYLAFNGADEHWMSYREGYRKVDLAEIGNFRIDMQGEHRPLKWQVHHPMKTRMPQISVFNISSSQAKPPVPAMPFRPLYDVLGSAATSGDKPLDIGPLHLPGLRGGRITIQITDAIEAKGQYGTLRVQSSHDGEVWFDTHNSGLSRGTMILRQDNLKTGDMFQDELYLTNHGEYLRVRYSPKKIAGWGFRATVTLETKW